MLVLRFGFRRGAKHKPIKEYYFLEFFNTELGSKNVSDARRRKIEDFKKINSSRFKLTSHTFITHEN
jgi:hypothetical protein